MKEIISIDKPNVILIVDDVVQNLQVLGTTLMQHNYEISMANNGSQALKQVEKVNPDLILLDVQMPDMNGFEVCEKLKSMEKFKDIPVIFLTAKTEAEDILQGFDKGGVDYITKPFNKQELLARIKTHIELKKARDIILEQNHKLESLNKEKTEILGIAAHDLKNPLSNIKGLAEVVETMFDELDKEDIEDSARKIRMSSEYMFQIISDLLDINAIEEGKMKLNIEPFNFVDVASRTFEKYNLKAADKSIKLIFSSIADEIYVNGDVIKTIQVLDNLVSNALKFSPFDRNIYVNIAIDDDQKFATAQIKDEGPGISPEDLKKLFGKFAKLSARPTNNENSTGLGLSIVKKLVDNMDGKIRCESRLGEGTSFFLSLPVFSE
ncbi:MAG: hybrid sensor histidine kinase/response regulator [Candidatus Kapabacteria bacterium]|nr:hybrid sensor histidine kinase/response regulator [Ignavibacteriota bacterium]MCW5885634.1 hybrid sensor histidine kinase/response regulator [Candidatus Kapabacteria bacterium]